jgi:hypothetical protein
LYILLCSKAENSRSSDITVNCQTRVNEETSDANGNRLAAQRKHPIVPDCTSGFWLKQELVVLAFEHVA